MEISFYELKLLRYISALGKHCPVITNEMLYRKFDRSCIYSLRQLYKNGCIACNWESSGNSSVYIIQPEEDNWTLTDKGKCLIENNKLKATLSIREKLFNYFLGFCSGVLSGCIIQLFIHFLL